MYSFGWKSEYSLSTAQKWNANRARWGGTTEFQEKMGNNYDVFRILCSQAWLCKLSQ